MDAHLEGVALRFHKRLLRYHKIGFAYCMAEGVFLAAFYHALCVGVELFAVAFHMRGLK